MAHLPTHPFLTHPLTGRPLEAVGIIRGRPLWPILGAAEDDGEGGGGEGGAGQQGDDGTSSTYPANTPWQDMKPGEQVAYWKAQSRRHEERAKPFRDLTPEKLAEIRGKAERQDALEAEMASEKDRAVAEAKTATQAEAEARYKPLLAETAFRVAIGDRKTQDEVDEFIADLNLPRFLTGDGHVDTAKVLARVEQFAPVTGTQQQQRPGPSANGQGNRSGNRAAAGGHNVSAGRDLYQQLHPAKK